MEGIVTWAINQSRLVWALIVASVAMGYVAFTAIPREADPDIQFPFINVALFHPGISPEDAERLLIRPMETELRTIEGLTKITATAAQGRAYIGLEFDVNFDGQKALLDVREKVDMAKAELPADTLEPVVTEASNALDPSIRVVLSGDIPDRTLYRIARDLSDRIETLPMVLSADISGTRQDLLEVVIDPAKLESYGVTPLELFNAVSRNNQIVAAGSLDSGQGRFAVKVPGLIESREDVFSLPIKANGDTVVTLGDVADVKRTFVDADRYARFNGRPAVTLDVVKRSGTNIMQTIEATKAIVAEAQKQWPETVQVSYTSDASVWIDRTLNSLTQGVILAIILVMIVVVGSLGLRSGLLVGFAIPLSFMLGIMFLWAYGLTLNSMVMFSLILVVGILVDGAIIVTEFADRKLAEGVPAREAYRLAGTRMFWPVVSSTATTIAAFLPMLFWPGIPGKFMSYMPITLIAVLAASTIVAIVFLPVIGAKFGKRGEGSGEALKALAASERGNTRDIPGFTGFYARVVEGAIKRPAVVVWGAFFSLIVVWFVFINFNKGVEFFVESDPEFGNVFVSARGNLSAAEKRDLTLEVEKRVLTVAGLKGVSTVTGIQGGGWQQVPEDAIGQISVELLPYEQRRSGAEIFAELRQVTAGIPGVKVEVREAQGGPVQGKDINIELSSENQATLEAGVTKLLAFMQAQPGLAEIGDSRPLPGIEWNLKVDRAQAGIYGADVADVGAVVQLVTNGIKVGEYRPDDASDEVDIRVRFPEEYRSLQALSQLRVPTRDGLVPITNFVTLTPQSKVDKIVRVDGNRVLSVNANAAPGALSGEEVAKIKDWVAQGNLGPGINVKYRGEDEQTAQTAPFLAFAGLAVLLMIGGIMLLQFNSFWQTAIVLSAVIFSTAGVLIGVLIMGQKLSVIMSGTGIVALAGIIVNNNIVLVDTYNYLMRQGMAPMEAIVRTAAQRLRPVLLTKVTTIAGLLPMMLAFEIDFTHRTVTIGGPDGAWWIPMATAIVWGLLFAGLLTLVVTPCMLALPHVMKERGLFKWLGRYLNPRRLRKDATPAPVPAE
jgi:multidrug efflux pump